MSSAPWIARPRLPATASGWLRAGVLAAALLALVLGVAARALAGTSQSAPALVGRLAPAWTLPVERAGQRLPTSVTLASERGHPVLLVFFYTLCVHCLSQVQTAAAVGRDETARGLSVLYVDSPAERPDIVAAYLDRLQIDAPVLLDADGAVAERYGVRFYPTLVLVDGGGVVRGVWLGETSTAPIERALSAHP